MQHIQNQIKAAAVARLVAAAAGLATRAARHMHGAATEVLRHRSAIVVDRPDAEQDLMGGLLLLPSLPPTPPDECLIEFNVQDNARVAEVRRRGRRSSVCCDLPLW